MADTPPRLHPASSPASGPAGLGSPPLSPGVTSGARLGCQAPGLLRRVPGVWTVVTPCLLRPEAQGLQRWRPSTWALPPACTGPWKVRWAFPHLPGVQREFGPQSRGGLRLTLARRTTSRSMPAACRAGLRGRPPARPSGAENPGEERGSGTLHHEVHRLPLRLCPKLRVVSSDPGQWPPAAHDGLPRSLRSGEESRRRAVGSGNAPRALPSGRSCSSGGPAHRPPPPRRSQSSASEAFSPCPAQ